MIRRGITSTGRLPLIPPGGRLQPEPARREDPHQPRSLPHARRGLSYGPAVIGAHRESPPQRYQIRVRGWLGQTIRSAFPALEARGDGGDIVLTGMLTDDQAALYGVLAEVEALGLELIEVRCLPE